MPGGLTFSEAGVISGTPTTGGTFNFTVKAVNSASNDTKALSIVIANETRNIEHLTPTYTITATAATGGTVNGGGTFNQGLSVTLMATAKSGYTFSGWYENGKRVSTNAKYTFTATNGRALQARFTVNKKKLSKPKKLKLTTKNATWNKVANNNGYTLKIMQGTKTIKVVQIRKNKISYILPASLKRKLRKNVKTYFTLIAKGKGNYTNSKTARSKVVKIK